MVYRYFCNYDEIYFGTKFSTITAVTYAECHGVS